MAKHYTVAVVEEVGGKRLNSGNKHFPRWAKEYVLEVSGYKDHSTIIPEKFSTKTSAIHWLLSNGFEDTGDYFVQEWRDVGVADPNNPMMPLKK